jgi:hypothetical protein
MPTVATCCGKTPREISIDVEGSGLTMVVCDRCERRQWFKDGEPVDIDAVKATASGSWNRKLKPPKA